MVCVRGAWGWIWIGLGGVCCSTYTSVVTLPSKRRAVRPTANIPIHTHDEPPTKNQQQEGLLNANGNGNGGGPNVGMDPRVGEAVRQLANEHVLPGVVALLQRVNQV